MEMAKESSASAAAAAAAAAAGGSSERYWLSPWWPLLVSSLENLKAKAMGLFDRLKKIGFKAKKIGLGLFDRLMKIGKADPRRISHSLKVGLALTLVSVFYYVNSLFNGLGESTIWAVLTVVVVSEYTVGGTLGKGLNRAFATFLAGSLGVGAHHIAALAGEKGEPILVGIFVFLLASAATFSRFIPEIKARYDYGVTIFILTFSLVAVSGYRVEEVLGFAQHRLSTVAIGVGICILTSVLVFPVWAGEDLHKLVAANLDMLASFFDGLGSEYLVEKDGISENLEGKPFLQVYKNVLNSKPTEETLANFARWEPGHGRFSFRHPWRQYLKIGSLSRQCAYSIEALTTYITTVDKNQTTTDPDARKMIRSACTEMSSASAMALSDLASSIRNMTSPSAASLHVDSALAASGKLKAILLPGGAALSDVIRHATTASLLAQVVASTHQIAGAVEELARSARFRKTEPAEQAAVKPVAEGGSPPHVAIDVE